MSTHRTRALAVRPQCLERAALVDPARCAAAGAKQPLLRATGRVRRLDGGQKSGRLRRVWPAALVGSAHGPLARFGPGLLHAPCTHALLKDDVHLR